MTYWLAAVLRLNLFVVALHDQLKNNTAFKIYLKKKKQLFILPNAIPSDNAASWTPAIVCKIKYILEALPTSPKKNEFRPIASKHVWHSSNNDLSPAAKTTRVPSSACLFEPWI